MEDHVSIINDPIVIQQTILSKIQRDSQGAVTVRDPNNPASIHIDNFSYITQEYTNEVRRYVNSLYARQARNIRELTRFLSRDQSLRIQAQPASYIVDIFFDLDNLLNLANTEYKRNEELSEDDILRRLIIPRNSIIQIAGYTFSIPYSIEFLIHTVTRRVQIKFLDDADNFIKQLFPIDTVELSYITSRNNGINELRVTVQVYQYETEVLGDGRISLSDGVFNRNYNFLNSFFGVSVKRFNNLNSNIRREINYTIIDEYDKNDLTAIVTVNHDTNKLNIHIPIIYFTNALIRTTEYVNITLYTTRGYVEITFSPEDIRDAVLNIAPSERDPMYSNYSNIFTSATTTIVPKTNVVVGGKNTDTFEIIRNLVVNINDPTSTTTTTVVTINDLRERLQLHNYTLVIINEVVTNPIFKAVRQLIHNRSEITTYSDLKIRLNNEAIRDIGDQTEFSDNQYRHVLRNRDGVIIIYPENLYLINDNSRFITPLTHDLLEGIENESKAGTVELFNLNNYGRQPFHLYVFLENNIPDYDIVNFSTPRIPNIILEIDNTSIVQSIAVTDYFIERAPNGYKIRLAVFLENIALDPTIDLSDINSRSTDNIQSLNNREIKVMLIYEFNNNLYYLPATDISPAGAIYSCDIDILTVFDRESGEAETFRISMFDEYTEQLEIIDIPFNSEFKVVTYIDRNVDLTNPNNPIHQSNIDLPHVLSRRLRCKEYRCLVNFGMSLKDRVFNRLSITGRSNLDDNYQRYQRTQYDTLKRTEYQRDIDGVPIYITRSSGNDRRVDFVEEVFKNADGDPFIIFDDRVSISPFVLDNETITVEYSNLEYDPSNSLHLLRSDITRGLLQSEILNLVLDVSPDGHIKKVVGSFDLDENGQKIPINRFGHQHVLGRIKLDENANPIFKTDVNELNKTSIDDFFISTFLIDNKYYLREDLPNTTNIERSLTNIILNQIEEIIDLRQNVSESIDLRYDVPDKSNIHQFITENNFVITRSSEFSISLNVYVDSDVSNPSRIYIRNQIIEIIRSNLEQDLLTVSNIVKDIDDELSTLVNSVDNVIIDQERQDIQTMRSVNPDVVKTIRYILNLNENDQIEYIPDVTINFLTI